MPLAVLFFFDDYSIAPKESEWFMKDNSAQVVISLHLHRTLANTSFNSSCLYLCNSDPRFH